MKAPPWVAGLVRPAVVTAWICALAAACTSSGPVAPLVAACRPATSVGAASKPNIVLVLTDDLSSNLVRYMPHVRALARAGTTFTNYTVTDSLCCPSRASIFTGRFPHDTGIFTNAGPDGGFDTFHVRGEEQQTFATALQTAGYRTALMGKYLNNYLPSQHLGGTRPYVPPGWSEWDVAGYGYAEFNYHLNQNHRVVHYGRSPKDYLTDVLARRATEYVGACSVGHQPFFLEVATFAPHRPYVPAPRDAHSFPTLKAPRTAAFDRLPRHPPPWLARRPPLRRQQIDNINRIFRRRVQSVLDVDRAIGAIQAELQRSGDAANTDFIFSSDNGYHLGEHRLAPGKMTAFDTDIRVPLIAAGPHILAGRVSRAVVENVDLTPTIEALAGLSPSPLEDGRSLLPLLRGASGLRWRTSALIEHHGPVTARTAGPDEEGTDAGNPPSYEAMRTATYLYVEYVDGGRELYDLLRDPEELDNLASAMSSVDATVLHHDLLRLSTCAGAAPCWRAAGFRLPSTLPKSASRRSA